VLIAARDAENRALYRQGLLDCDTVEACEGREALVKAFVRPLALVVSETELPLISGLELIGILKHDLMTADVPIVAITASADELAPGADHVLMKPVSPETVALKARWLLDHPRSPRGSTTSFSGVVAQRCADDQPARSAEPQRSSPKKCPRYLTTSPPPTAG
jgi:CheY-like chemotaxis protein